MNILQQARYKMAGPGPLSIFLQTSFINIDNDYFRRRLLQREFAENCVVKTQFEELGKRGLEAVEKSKKDRYEYSVHE